MGKQSFLMLLYARKDHSPLHTNSGSSTGINSNRTGKDQKVCNR